MNSKTRQRFSILQQMQRLGIQSKEEELALDQWLDNVKVIDEITFESEEEADRIKDGMKSVIDNRIAAEQFSAHPKNKLRTLFKSIGIAAAIVIGIGAGVYYLWDNGFGSKEKLVSVSVPQNIEKLPVLMPDSSVVWVAGGSKLTYPVHFAADSRKVTLNGTGYFTIKPNKNAPFIVHTDNNLSVKVLGTSFVVDQKKAFDRIEISVITGVVQVNNNKSELSILKPGEKFFYALEDNVYFKKKYNVSEVMKWADDRMIVLNSVSLDEIAVILDVMYHMQLDFDRSIAIKYRFNMSFSKDLSIEEFIRVLGNTSGLEFQKNGNRIKVRT